MKTYKIIRDVVFFILLIAILIIGICCLKRCCGHGDMMPMVYDDEMYLDEPMFDEGFFPGDRGDRPDMRGGRDHNRRDFNPEVSPAPIPEEQNAVEENTTEKEPQE